MKKLQLDSVLLFILVIPVIMTYRISPGATPFWLFGIIFVLVLLNIIVDLLDLKKTLYNRIKQSVLWSTITLVIGSVFVSAIIVRHVTHPVYNIHDIVLQQEAAIRFLLDGKNPYSVTYFGTFLEQWHYSDTEINPALYHFVMQPFYIIFALPFYVASNMLLGFFDGRIPLLFLLFVMFIVASILVKNQEKKRQFIIFLALNPAMFSYTLEGRSDMFMYPLFMLGLYLLHVKKLSLAGIPIGLAFAVKQSVWPLLPFYIAYVWFSKRKETIKVLIPFITTCVIVIAPFFFWNQQAYMDSTIRYLSGTAEHSYPISGYGFGKLLQEVNVIKDAHAYFPFEILQLFIGIPLLLVLLRYLKKEPSIGRMLVCYGIFLFVYWYFSRYFNNSHVGYLTTVFIAAYFWPAEDEKN